MVDYKLRLLLVILLILAMSLNVLASSGIFEKKVNSFREMIKDLFKSNNNSPCISKCLDSEQGCLSKCKKINYAVCRNNCFNQRSKCKQDCKSEDFLNARKAKAS